MCGGCRAAARRANAQANVRITGLCDYTRPWKWKPRLLWATIPTGEILIFVLYIVSNVVLMIYQCADALIFANPPDSRPGYVATWVRPLANLVARKVAAAIMRRAVRGTMNPASKIWCMLYNNLFLGILQARLVMSCMSMYDVGAALVLDWPLFFARASIYWMSTSEAYLRGDRLARNDFVNFWLMRIVRSETIDQTAKIPEFNKRHFRGLEFHFSNVGLSSAFIAMLLGYGWYVLLGLDRTNPAFALWFPAGSNAAWFGLIAYANDFVQDLAAHAVVRVAESRHKHPCHFSRVFPGWVYKPKGLLRAAMVASVTIWVPVWISQFAFVFRQRGLI